MPRGPSRKASISCGVRVAGEAVAHAATLRAVASARKSGSGEKKVGPQRAARWRIVLGRVRAKRACRRRQDEEALVKSSRLRMCWGSWRRMSLGRERRDIFGGSKENRRRCSGTVLHYLIWNCFDIFFGRCCVCMECFEAFQKSMQILLKETYDALQMVQYLLGALARFGIFFLLMIFPYPVILSFLGNT